MKILFVQTGGTIDKDYPKTTNGWGFEISDEPAARRLLEERLRPTFQYEHLTVCLKDSTEITGEDRAELLRRVRGRLDEGEYSGVVVTHGTDTMAETAAFLAERMHHQSPPVILTGAMRPERFSNSDADFNLGMAVAAVQLAKKGFVGICMHGLVLSHDEIDRNLQTGQFLRKGT